MEKIKEIDQVIQKSWEIIPPAWPLKSWVAVNPLRGLEDMPFEKAIKKAEKFFQQKAIPKELSSVNRQTIKWCQAFFDEGQATIKMPFQEKGFFNSWKTLAIWDRSLHQNNKQNQQWLKQLPDSSEEAISTILSLMDIPQEKRELFLSLLLTTLSGWAAHVQYLSQWKTFSICRHELKADYLAVRLAITYLLWPKASQLFEWFQENQMDTLSSGLLEKIYETEELDHSSFLKQIEENAKKKISHSSSFDAQLVFCIDVRSEPFRRAIEKVGNYETFGFAGFFGVPVWVHDERDQSSYAACPVLIQPKHDVNIGSFHCKNNQQSQKSLLKKIYYSLKYTFTAPFALMELLGPFVGVWMGLKTFLPKLTTRKSPGKNFSEDSLLKKISFADQCLFAENALRGMDLIKNFAPIILLCGHESSSANNAFSSSLDCGACGGHSGYVNAQILAKILNSKEVRKELEKRGVAIPERTEFLAAVHNTTTDELSFEKSKNHPALFEKLKRDFSAVQKINAKKRIKTLSKSKRGHKVFFRSADWAEVRPEWGLAKNAFFIAAPRFFSKEVDLKGRSFLHSYNWENDPEGKILTNILTAPLIVAQWINHQYLFSSLDNTAYGSGNKITQNVTGKIGIMQGNSSDLMNGLPFQSVYDAKQEFYHRPVRLFCIVYAPKKRVESIVLENSLLKKLVGNGWIYMSCFDPNEKKIFRLKKSFYWEG